MFHQRGLQRLQPGVFALAGAHSGPAQRAKAVELAVGQPALVTGWSALHLYGLVRAAPSSVHVLLPHARRSPDLPRVVAHRTSTWAQAGAAKAAGVAVSSPARSIVVVAREAELEQRRLLRLEDLAACVAGWATPPAPRPCGACWGSSVRLRSGRVLHVDIAWSAMRVGLECDGFGSHAERAALDTDALRHNGLAMWGGGSAG